MCKITEPIVYLFLLFSLSSCKPSQDQVVNQNHVTRLEGELIFETKVFEIEKDKYLPSHTTFCRTFSAGQHEYLGWINNAANSLDVFNLDNGQLVDRIYGNPKSEHFFETGRDNNKVKGFLQLSSGKILLLMEYFLGGNIIYDLDKKNTDTLILSSEPVRNIIYYTNQPEYLGKTISFTKDPLYNPLKPIHYLQLAWEGSIEITSNTFNEENIPLPKIYYNKIVCPGLIIPSQCLGRDSSLYYSFPLSDSIYISNTSGQVERKYAGIPKNPISQQFNGNVQDNEKCADDYVNIFMYEGLYFDPYRQLYFRFFSTKNKNSNTPNDKNFGFLVLDKDLSKLSVFSIPYPFFGHEVFISKKGLFISLNHSDNPDNIEGKLRFLNISFKI